MTKREFDIINSFIQAFVDETLAEGTVPCCGIEKITYTPEQMDKLVERIKLLVKEQNT